MAPSTRSGASSPVKKMPVASSATPEVKHNPVKVLIAPRDISPNVRILPLRQPCDGLPKNFMFCPDSGLYELKKSALPSTDLRSIIFTPTRYPDANEPMVIDVENDSFCEGYINKDAEILTATPYDLTFILLRSIAPQTINTTKSLFQPLEDLLDSPELSDKSIRYIIDNGSKFVHEAMSRISDEVEAGDEKMFRYNEEKVFSMIMEKAQRVSRSGLPASLEDQFVTRLLEAPMMSIKREEATISITAPSTATGKDQFEHNSLDSQLSSDSTTTSVVFSEISATSTVMTIPEDVIPAEVKRLQRIKTAYNFITATCLPPFIAARIGPRLLAEDSPVNFTPLEEYLKQLAILKAEAAASRSMTDFSRKRGLEDEEIAEERAEKKRKQEEDEKRKKANESRGVRELKKVNVSGMKKMSDFFSKKPVSATVKAKT